MKKKLLTVLLSVFMVMTTFTTRVFAVVDEIFSIDITLNTGFGESPTSSNLNAISDPSNIKSISITYKKGGTPVTSALDDGDYTVDIIVKASEGYGFPSEPEISVNESYSLSNLSGFNTDTLSFTYSFHVDAPATAKKIIDILPDGFPTDYTTGWVYENCYSARVFKNDGCLCFDNNDEFNYSINLNEVLTFENGEYKYTSTFMDGSKACELVCSFAMNGETLSYIDLSLGTNLYQEVQGWYVESVTVKFNMNGYGTQVLDQVIPIGTTATEPTNPTTDGYIFDGWYRSASCDGSPFNFDTPITKDLIGDERTITLYAKWKQPTIADILELGTKSFPITKETGWTNGTHYLYVDDNKLRHSNSDEISTSILAASDGSNYKVVETDIPNLTYTFVIANNRLEKIVITGDEGFNGTYTAQIKTVGDVIETYHGFPSPGGIHWTNGNGSKSYYDPAESLALFIDYNSSIKSVGFTDTVTKKSDGVYECESNGVIFTFYVVDNALTYFSVSGSEDITQMNGDYYPPQSIDTVDLSSLNIGKDYVGKTPADFASTISVFETDEFKHYDHKFNVKGSSGTDYAPMNDSDKFENGKTYAYFGNFLAKDGYFFAGKDDNVNNYSGTTVPSETLDKTVSEVVGDYITTEGKYLHFAFEFTVVEEKTIEDILNTVDDGFPTSDSSTAPDNAWKNANGKGSMFVNTSTNALHIDEIGLVGVNYTLSKNSEGNYTISGEGITLTFVVNDNELSKVKVEGMPDPVYKDYNGTYTNPTPVAQIGNTKYYSLPAALEAADAFDAVILLTDITNSTENINVKPGVILDLNNHVLKTTGTVKNNGTISLYNENADIIDYLLYNHPGYYGAGEELKLPDSANPKYIVPEGTFLVTDVDTDGNQILAFDTDDDYLVWNTDVKKGTWLKVGNSLALGGNIIAPTDPDGETIVETTNLKLNNDVTVGSNSIGDGKAELTVESYDSIDDSHVKGSINANGHKFILNKTGALIVSSDIKFDESILTAGVDGMMVGKEYDSEKGAYTYTIGNEHHYTNNPFTVEKGYDKDLEFVTNADTWEEKDVTIKVDGKVIDSSKYDLDYGSLHITLHGDYIKSLSAGKHTLTTVVTGYATINQDFYIKAKPSPSPTPYVIPNTGVN